MTQKKNIGLVIIGRNEGERLLDCLGSVRNDSYSIVYVDSGSTDGSVKAAKSLGAEVVELDMAVPFTAARARNAGFERLYKLDIESCYVQFVDGDCIVDSGWLKKAEGVLDENLSTAIVCGRRRERYPEKTIYNYLCDIEWDTPVGEAKACGGDFMIRTELFRELKGFNESLIAGEEPELCIRVRQHGYKIQRINEEMTLHDANITTIRQWWKRNVRGGYAFAEGAYMNGGSPEFHWVAESKRIWIWALVFPLLIMITTFVFGPLFFIGFLVYPIQLVRMTLSRGISEFSSWSYSCFLILGKFPELQGQLYFWFNQLMRLKGTLIEYK